MGGQAANAATASGSTAVTADDLLEVVAQSLPQLVNLEVGSCYSLSQQGLTMAVAQMGRLKTLKVHQLLLSMQQCQEALLHAAADVKYFESARDPSSGGRVVNAFALAWYERQMMPV